jgi:DNA-binding beta-propeller fold protein YncE
MVLAQASLIKFAVPLAVAITLAPASTQTAVMDFSGSQLCLPENAYGVAAESYADLVSTAPHEEHVSSGKNGPEWQKPRLATFHPETANVSFEIVPAKGVHVAAGSEARVIVRIADKASGLPISGRSIAGWMQLRRNAQVSAELSCAAKAHLFTQGRVTQRPDVDLNSRRMLVLDRLGAISVVDPQIDFTITQMQKVIPLPGVPADWALSPDGQNLFVSIPVLGAVAVIDTKRYEVKNLIELGKGTLPTRLKALPDGRAAVFLSGTGQISISAADDTQVAHPVAFHQGEAAFEIGGTTDLFAATSAGFIEHVDTGSGRILAKVQISEATPALTFAAKAVKLFAATSISREIIVLDPQTLVRTGSIPVEPGLSTLVITPDGGNLLATNSVSNELLLIDPFSGKIRDRQRVASKPVEITFTSEYAYVRGLGDDHFTLVELAEIANGRIVPVNIQSASRDFPAREALRGARLVAPYGHGALIANPDERVAYYYMEGMNTVMGTVGIYTPQAQSIMTVDRGFREANPGVYESSATLPFAGVYDVPIAIDTDDNVQCFTARVEAAPGATLADDKPSITAVAEIADDDQPAQRKKIIVRLLDTKTSKPVAGVGDVRVLAFSSSGAWQGRKWAKDIGEGRYAADWSFPTSGRYGISVSVKSRELAFADQPPIYLSVGATDRAGAAGERKTLP